MNNSNSLTFLGTGTSVGVPQMLCNCRVCRSSDPRDRRMRSCALLQLNGHNILIDCGPDIRTQLLRAGNPKVDSMLITHIHSDHVGGLEDMRPYCYNIGRSDYREGDPVTPRALPTYCRTNVAQGIKERLPYCFATERYPGSPSFDLHEIADYETFTIENTDIEVTPIPVEHFPGMMIQGFRFGDLLAYITDCKVITQRAIEALKGVDTLVINALRHEPHMSHMSLSEALAVVEKVAPRRTYLTHLCHDMGLYAEEAPKLPAGVEFAVDNLTIEL